MALGKSNIAQRSYKTLYTVPANKRATVNITALAQSDADIVVNAGLAPTIPNGIFQDIGEGVGAPAGTPTTQTFTGALTNDNLGYAVAIDGNYAVIGTGASALVVGQIRIYFYNGTTWTLQQTITDPANDVDAFFGSAVAISGNNIVVGAFGNDQENNNAGRAYRYTRSGTTWSLAATFINPSANGNAAFGQSVAIAGDFIVIGSSGYDPNGVNSNVGRAYGYRVSTGATLQTTFTNPNNLSGEFYGFSVGCWSDGRVMIGSYGFNNGALNGRVYYYAAFTNTLTATITNPNNQSNDRFGYTVACDKTGTFFAVGSEGFQNGAFTGRVYTYSTQGLTGTVNTSLATIANPVAQTTSYFGTGLAMGTSGDLLVGSYQYDGAQSNQGRTYYFTRSGNVWTLANTFENPTPNGSDFYGFGVALGNQDLVIDGLVAGTEPVFVIGAYLDDSNALSNNGAADITNQKYSAGQLATLQNQVDLTKKVGGLDNGLDLVSLASEQTFERTGLVLDAGESVILTVTSTSGEITAQVRGFEEDV